MKNMQKIIELNVKPLDANGDNPHSWIDEANAHEFTYTFSIDASKPPMIFHESIEDLYDDVKWNKNQNNVGTVVVKKGTKFHFTPGVKFTRQQCKERQQAHGVKSIRDISKADYIIIDNNMTTKTVQQK